jgi:hypothetical protein
MCKLCMQAAATRATAGISRTCPSPPTNGARRQAQAERLTALVQRTCCQELLELLLQLHQF